MKKTLCLLLAVLLSAVWAGAALGEVFAYYSGGIVTVNADERGYWEIFIDSEWTGYRVDRMNKTVSIPLSLEDGSHEVLFYNSDENQRLYYTFEVMDGRSANAPATPAPTATPAPAATPAPKGPVKLTGASYAAGVIRCQVSGLRGYAEIWVDGVNTGLILTENGENSFACLLAEGEHTLALYLPAYNETASLSFHADAFRPDAESLRAALQSLLENEAGQTMGSGLAIDRDETGYLLRVSVNGRSNVSLTVSSEQLETLLSQGLTVVEYETGKAALRIDLTQLTSVRFSSGAAVTAYSFSVNAGEEGVQVTVTGKTDGGETVEAEKLAGVSLIRDGKRTFLTRNGLY